MQSVNILCLDNPLGAWDESSLKTGVGGSETAVIGLATILRDKKYGVTVFNDVKSRKAFKSQNSEMTCHYEPKSQLDEPRGSFNEADTWIVWRSPKDLLKIKEKDGRKILWLHDLIPESEVMQYMHFCDKI